MSDGAVRGLDTTQIAIAAKQPALFLMQPTPVVRMEWSVCSIICLDAAETDQVDSRDSEHGLVVEYEVQISEHSDASRGPLMRSL